MQFRRQHPGKKVNVEGELYRGESRIARVRCTFDDMEESTVVQSFGDDGPVELPDFLHDLVNGHLQVLEGGRDLGMIEDLELVLTSGERWLVKVSRNETLGGVDWRIQRLSTLSND